MVELLDERRPGPSLEAAIERFERGLSQHLKSGRLGTDGYVEMCQLLDEARQDPEADQWNGGLAGLQLTVAVLCHQPVEEVERLLRTTLRGPAPVRDARSRVGSISLACSAYPHLTTYRDTEVEALLAFPPSELRDSLLQALRDL